MSKPKAERHLDMGDRFMEGGASARAFKLYNSALGNFQKANDVEGQRRALRRMLSAAEASGNSGMAANCRKWLQEL